MDPLNGLFMCIFAVLKVLVVCIDSLCIRAIPTLMTNYTVSQLLVMICWNLMQVSQSGKSRNILLLDTYWC